MKNGNIKKRKNHKIALLISAIITIAIYIPNIIIGIQYSEYGWWGVAGISALIIITLLIIFIIVEIIMHIILAIKKLIESNKNESNEDN